MDHTFDERAYIARWYDLTSERFAFFFLVSAFPYTLGSAFLIPVVMPPEAARLLGWNNNLICLFSAIGLLLVWRKRSLVIPLTKVLLLGAAAGIAYASNRVLQGLPDATANWRFIITVIAIPGIFGVIWPDQRRSWIPACAFFTATTFYSIRPLGYDGHTLVVLVLAAAIVFFAKGFMTHLLRIYARQEMNIERLAKEGERAKIEQEMEVARRIQDSFSDDADSLETSRTRIKWFQARHGIVGGDWVTTRVFDDGRVVAMVVDAAGKGVQAALVVHAVQSLWADALTWRDFDPRMWIKRVNATLLTMGRKSPHSVTLGLVDIRDDRLEYWSAGHVPLYCVERTDLGFKTLRVFGKGSVLGINPEYDIAPIEVSFAERELDVILSSDGLSNDGKTLKKRDIELLIAQINHGGIDAVKNRKSEDDVSVVWIKSAA